MEKKSIERFLDAQNATYAGYDQALEEVRNGCKVLALDMVCVPPDERLGA